MKLFGYARASTSQQSLEAQVQALQAEGVKSNHIFTDTVIGPGGKRDGLRSLQVDAQPGDLVLVARLYCLGRNIAELIDLIKAFDQQGVALRFLDDDLSTEGGRGTLIVAILSAVAQAERQRLHERSIEGRTQARKKGVKFGRKPSVDREKVQTLRVQGLGATDIARQMNIGRSTVYKILQSLLIK